MADTRQVEFAREEQLRQAEAALAESLEERNRLWAEVKRLQVLQHENEYLRRLYSGLETSLSWRLTKPLRELERIRRDLQARLRPKSQD
jgi:hypothetical protein